VRRKEVLNEDGVVDDTTGVKSGDGSSKPREANAMNSKLLALGVVIMGAPLAASAQETLDYSAGIFSGQVTLNGPLPENGNDTIVAPTEFNFPGIGFGASYNYLCTGCGYALGGMSEYGGASFEFTTLNGHITAWDIDIDFTGTPGTNTQTSLYATISNTGDAYTQQAFGASCMPAQGQPNPCPPVSAGTSNVGGWTTAVPEIDQSVALSGMMLLLVGVTVLRSRRV
jgi:hypothetical protein